MNEKRSRAETLLILEMKEKARTIERELLELKVVLAPLYKDRERLDALDKFVAARGRRGLRLGWPPDELRERLDHLIATGEWPDDRALVAQPER